MWVPSLHLECRKLSTKGWFKGASLGLSLVLCNPSKAIVSSAKQYHCTTLTLPPKATEGIF